jgi:membrane-bound lytic murein transglycosylase D
MAAYNGGPVTIERAVERTGYANFWELRRRNVLPIETGNYVPIILAMAIMAKNPAHYELDATVPEPPLEYSTIEVDAAVHLELIADIAGRPLSEIREMNPALLTKVAPGGYAVHVPAGTEAAVVSALKLIPPAQRTAWRLHRVANGDTLAGIAQLYRAAPQQIAAVNSSAAAGLEPGDLLIVPVSAQPVKQVVKAKPSSRPAVKAASKKQPAKTPSTALVASKSAPGRQSSATPR